MMTQLILMAVRTQPSMVEAMMTKRVMNEKSETGFGSLTIVKGVDRLIYISDTDMAEGQR
jgi:hypothetical protein